MFSQEEDSVPPDPVEAFQRFAARRVTAMMQNLTGGAVEAGVTGFLGPKDKIHLFMVHEESLIEEACAQKDIAVD